MIKTLEDETMGIPKLNTKVIETWINETLKECEVSSLPKNLINDSTKSPLSRFGIDRDKLLV